MDIALTAVTLDTHSQFSLPNVIIFGVDDSCYKQGYLSFWWTSSARIRWNYNDTRS